MIRVLVVDDSALMRKVIKEILETDPEIKVIDIARDGEEAVEKALKLKPDVITLDINMPKQDGITALQWILHYKICPVVMVSSLTHDGAVITFEALELGAFDYVEKPDGTVSRKMHLVKQELIEKVKAAYYYGRDHLEPDKIKETYKKNIQTELATIEKYKFKKSYEKYPAIVLGISTGGPQTLSEILPMFPSELPAYFFIIQHMPSGFTSSFANRLNKICKLPVEESKAAEKIKPSKIYIAKGGYHLTLFKRSETDIIIRHKTKPETVVMPSVDIAMESIAEIFREKTIGVLMTGMGNDGAKGMEKIKQYHGYNIAESSETAIVFGMPREAIERGVVDQIAPAYKIPSLIVEAVFKLDKDENR